MAGRSVIAIHPVRLLDVSIKRYIPEGMARLAIFHTAVEFSVQSRTTLGISSTNTIHNARHLEAEMIEYIISRIGFIVWLIIPHVQICKLYYPKRQVALAIG